MALLLFLDLMLALLIPLFVSHALELSTKRAFWAARGAHVVAARGPLLPLPKHPLLSHALVLVTWPMLLWAVAEQTAPHAVRLREWLFPFEGCKAHPLV